MTKTFEKDLEEVGYRYQSFFENSPVSLWEEDFSEVANYLDTLKAGGISDFSKYFNENPGELKACAQKVKVLDVNKAALALHGADSKEELLSNLDKTFTESSFDVFKEELSALAEGRTDFESEAEVKTLSGQPKNVHVKFSLMRTKKSGSDITRALVAITDITDRKRTEATLREREAQFRSVLAAAPDLMFVLDAKGRYRDIFTSTPDLLLVPRDQLLGKTIHEVMSPESAQPIQEGIDKTLLTGEPQRIDYSLEIGGVEKLFSARVVKFKFQGHDCVLWSARDITRQEEAEEASKKSHRKLIEAEQIAHMGFLDWNLKTNELVLSKEVYQLYGIDPETPVTPELLMNLLHPDDREPVITSLDLARQGISKHEMDHRVVRSDGSVIWLQARADLERDEEGVPISLLGTVVDITERKSIEEELTIKHEEIQRQYTELEQLYKHLPIGLCLVDSDLRYLRINKMLAEINGAPVDDHIGRTIREIIPQLADHVEQPYHRVLETAEPIVDMEVTGTTVAEPDTEKSWLASFYPIKSSSGKVCFVSTIVNDVTQRKKAEALLKDSEARFRMIYEHAPVMIDAFDSNGRCFMFNKECERVFGWTAEEIYAHENPLILFYPDPEIQRQVVETVTTEPEKVFREWKPRRKDGSETVCLWANFKLPDGLVINLGYDITERKKSEEDMRQLRSELLHTTRVLTMGELTAALAHELNHPLGSILNNANGEEIS